MSYVRTLTFAASLAAGGIAFQPASIAAPFGARAAFATAPESSVVSVRHRHYGKRYYRRGHIVDAPFAYVESGRRTYVEAPFTTVYVGRRGRYIRAPFVDLFIPD